MLSHLKISGFRAFRELRVDGLTRVNLFVGTNNSGKTSILEAAEMVALGKIAVLLRGPRRRGEIWISEGGIPTEPRHLDLSHLFYGHSPSVGSSFEISGGPQYWIRCKVIMDEGEIEEIPALHFEGSEEDKPRQLSFFPPDEALRFPSLLDIFRPVRFLGTELVPASQLGQLWDAVVLTPEEQGVVAAIQIVEPAIERIAFVGESQQRGIFLKPMGTEQRLPLGSAGDGLKRLLALALYLVSAREGFLLVDEIDTGLHHTVMVKMWKLVIETAKRMNVQVLATTHSLDCVRALASVQEQNPEIAKDVTLHRVERGLPYTVHYTTDELAIAAEHYLEVR